MNSFNQLRGEHGLEGEFGPAIVDRMKKGHFSIFLSFFWNSKFFLHLGYEEYVKFRSDISKQFPTNCYIARPSKCLKIVASSTYLVLIPGVMKSIRNVLETVSNFRFGDWIPIQIFIQTNNKFHFQKMSPQDKVAAILVLIVCFGVIYVGCTASLLACIGYMYQQKKLEVQDIQNNANAQPLIEAVCSLGMQGWAKRIQH